MPSAASAPGVACHAVAARGILDVVSPPARLSRRLPVAAVLALTACAGPGPSSSAPSPEAVTRPVEHVAGTTEVPVAPQRVVVLDLGALDSAVALGVAPVGAATAPGQDGLLPYLTAQTRGVETVGEVGAPDLGRIAALEPDLVLGSALTDRQRYDELSEIAPTVLAEGAGASWQDDLLVHAQALGRGVQAVALLEQHLIRSAELGAAVDDGTTVSVVRFVPGEIHLLGRESFVGTVLQDAGIARPPSQDVAQPVVTVSPQQTGRVGGDVVFVGTEGDPAGTDGPAVLSGPQWRQLPAVAAGRVHEVDDAVWFLGSGPGAADLVLDDLARVLGG